MLLETSAIFILSAVATFAVRLWLLRRNLLDHPNERSSHQQPTPRGGGVAFVIVFAGAFLFSFPDLPTDLRWLFGCVLLAALALASLGLADDLFDLSARFRLLVQAIVSALLIWLIGDIWIYQYFPGPVGPALAFLGLLWWINLFNFLDGIDGFAASEGIYLAGAALLLSAFNEGFGQVAPWSLPLIAAVCGFLLFNWPPARIFMGDVGSCALGALTGGLALVSLKLQLVPVWSWLLITAVFWIDATVTLVRRISRGSRWSQAHRSHAYQILSRRWKSHLKVTLLLWAINIGWLLPLAVAVAWIPQAGFVLFLAGVLPLLFGVIKVGAGIKND